MLYINAHGFLKLCLGSTLQNAKEIQDPFEIKNELIQVTKTDEVVSPKQPNVEFVDDEELDDDSYAILNKELRKQILVFEREVLKAEQVCMDIGDLLDSANEIINPESIKKTSVNQ